MKTTIRSMFSAAVVAAAFSATATAFAAKEPKNLKVLKPTPTLEKGMKELSKGLGVKCEACHVKGKFDSDDAPAKADARQFLQQTVGEKDVARREAALKKLLATLELESAKRAESVWQAVDRLEKK